MKFNPPLTTAELSAAFTSLISHPEALPDGIGGQGVVFKVIDHKGQIAALKVYYPGATSERTQREVNALTRIRCTSLACLRGSGTVAVRGEQCMYVLTDFISGQPLNDRVRTGPLSLSTVAAIGRDIALAIDALWIERIVHRDIKPRNIMLRGTGGAVLIDLGVARHLSLDSLTTLGKTWGTEGYMSPEQCAAQRQLSCKSDIFTLGIVLRECLTGRHPTNANQRALLMGAFGSAAALGLPIPVSAAIDAATSIQPFRRPLPRQLAAILAAHV